MNDGFSLCSGVRLILFDVLSSLKNIHQHFFSGMFPLIDCKLLILITVNKRLTKVKYHTNMWSWIYVPGATCTVVDTLLEK